MSQISKCPTLRVVLGYWEALGEVSEMRYNNLLYCSSKRSYCSKMTYIHVQIIRIRIKTIPPERRSSVIHGQPQRNLIETMKKYWEGWKKSRMLKLTTLNHWCFQNLVLSMSVMTQNMAAGKPGAPVKTIQINK